MLQRHFTCFICIYYGAFVGVIKMKYDKMHGVNKFKIYDCSYGCVLENKLSNLINLIFGTTDIRHAIAFLLA
jgi:hypothetical protein